MPNFHAVGLVNAIGYIDPNEPNRDFDPAFRHSHAHGDGHCTDCNSHGHAHPDADADAKRDAYPECNRCGKRHKHARVAKYAAD